MAKLTSLLLLDDLGGGLKGTDSRLLLLATSTEEFLVAESSTIGMLFFAEEELFLVVDAVDAVAGDLLEPLVDEGATAVVFLDFPTSGEQKRRIGEITMDNYSRYWRGRATALSLSQVVPVFLK